MNRSLTEPDDLGEFLERVSGCMAVWPSSVNQTNETEMCKMKNRTTDLWQPLIP